MEKCSQNFKFSKQQLKDVLSIAQNDRERECIRYTAFAVSGLSATGARKRFGFDRITERAEQVENAIEETKAIRSAIESISKIQEKTALAQFGIEISDDSDSNLGDESTSESDSEVALSPKPMSRPSSKAELIQLLKSAQFNWFEFACLAEEKGISRSTLEMQFENICSSLPPYEHEFVRHSHAAYLSIGGEASDQLREAAALNGDIVSESDSDNPDDYTGLTALTSERAKVLVKKKVAAIRRKNQRERMKMLSEKRFLLRKQSKKLKGILHDHPNIGKVMEEFVEERSIGADAWRRTGVLTFDGNKTVQEKVTYRRIQEHLQVVFKRKFSYGTVVELCVARNRRRRSAHRYKGVAKITSRRARKGFQLRYNPDNHWSAAFYRSLNFLQYADGRSIMNLNRDDAAGFRLDTLTTHRLHRTPVVRGKEIVTTHTDYVNSYPSLLQTTSYNFTGTKTTGEICAGVVKGAGVFEKNAAQHAADISMLQNAESIHSAFNTVTGEPKEIECIRVDGATDEGPSHLEVQYWWTLRHIQRPTIATLVTARNSGASYLNRVELQNGCLSLAHANLFIPSNLHGSCFDPSTGKVDNERLKRNMDTATDIYISRTNGAPCGDTKILLFKGADSSANQELRDDLNTFLKGTIVRKELLKRENPDRWAAMEKVWNIRRQHMVPDLPPQYVFYLKCFTPNCEHPLCQRSSHPLPTWYPGGPSLDFLPIPIPDPAQPWGSTTCLKCPGVCYGHYLTPELVQFSPLTPMAKPPSQILKEGFDKLKGTDAADSYITELAKATLLPPEEVKIWFEHLQTISRNRKRGAEKAAATRRQKKAATARYFCVCGKEYKEVTEEIESWIGCDTCNSWYHCLCVGVDPDNIPPSFICEKCSKN